MRVLYDTNILLLILRRKDSVEKLGNYLNSNYADPISVAYISIVTAAEIRSLAIQYGWGDIRLQKLNEFLLEMPTFDINSSDILDRYVDIDCYSQGKHPNLSSNFSAINMGKNDLWIAATASAHRCALLTMDKDFLHLNNTFVDVIYIRQEIFV